MDRRLANLLDHCSIVNPEESGRFVGLKISEATPHVSFPLGYRFPNSFLELQRDIRRLLGAIEETQSSSSLFLSSEPQRSEVIETGLPLKDFFNLVEDHLRTHRFYIEKQVKIGPGVSGAISWSRTISNSSPVITDGSNVVYLNLHSYTRGSRETSLISELHEFCTFESFSKIGWLYTSYTPTPPRLKAPTPRHLEAVSRRIGNSHNEYETSLLVSIMRVAVHKSREACTAESSFGTERFEYVWENLIDVAFGVENENKQSYFPRANWKLYPSDCSSPAPLEPDTIMRHENSLYILDAKYYRYGLTRNSSHLPGTSDINKQLTYGEYANYLVESKKVPNATEIYNIFLMPADLGISNRTFEVVGQATVPWKTKETRNANEVIAVLCDVPRILRWYKTQSIDLSRALANVIHSHISHS